MQSIIWKQINFQNYNVNMRVKDIYYIDMSVLPKNRQLIFSIRNYIRDTSEIFSISSLVKMSLKSFLWFSFVFRLVFFFRNTHIYVIKRKLHVGSLRSLMKYFFHLKIYFICSLYRVISSLYSVPV